MYLVLTDATMYDGDEPRNNAAGIAYDWVGGLNPGKARLAKLSVERSEFAKKAADTANAARSPRERSERARLAVKAVWAKRDR